MDKYISKSALVAEIERLREELQDKVETSDFIAGEVFIMNYSLSFLDTLEVKEVDLEKEIRRYRMNNPIIGHREESLHDYMTNVAKHFFELGMTVSNKTQKGE